MPLVTREIQLAARPRGEPRTTDFRLAEAEVRDPRPGEVLIRNTYMSVDPYMRGRMDDAESYVPPFRLDEPLEGGAVGEVVVSEAEGLAPGDVVVHQLGWREHALASAHHVRRVQPSDDLPPSVYLGVLGMPGLTAYVGLLDIGELRDGDVVFVSGAAGAVGSLAGQLAKLRGHRVIGSAGSAEKVALVRDELGFDAAFDYHDGPVARQLGDALRHLGEPGIDLYFDNVGGEHLEAAIGAMRLRGRVAMCGAIAGYNATEPLPGPRNLDLAIGRRLTLRGFIVTDHADRMRDLVAEVGPAARDGRIRFAETVVDGLEHAPDALIGMLRGDNVGKMLVRL